MAKFRALGFPVRANTSDTSARMPQLPRFSPVVNVLPPTPPPILMAGADGRDRRRAPRQRHQRARMSQPRRPCRQRAREAVQGGGRPPGRDVQHQLVTVCAGGRGCGAGAQGVEVLGRGH
eukprot:215013-Chlamydomonas_euryale.AAC.1